jgi:hypothetical protein
MPNLHPRRTLTAVVLVLAALVAPTFAVAHDAVAAKPAAILDWFIAKLTIPGLHGRDVQRSTDRSTPAPAPEPLPLDGTETSDEAGSGDRGETAPDLDPDG